MNKRNRLNNKQKEKFRAHGQTGGHGETAVKPVECEVGSRRGTLYEIQLTLF